MSLTGASGSGKSTLLYLLGALDRPTSGEVLIDGAAISALDDDARAALRASKLGFVFQFHFLLDSKNGHVVMDVFDELVRKGGITVLMVTHERAFAERASRQLVMKDGEIVLDLDQR